jgi:hypothetical protein
VIAGLFDLAEKFVSWNSLESRNISLYNFNIRGADAGQLDPYERFAALADRFGKVSEGEVVLLAIERFHGAASSGRWSAIIVRSGQDGL